MGHVTPAHVHVLYRVYPSFEHDHCNHVVPEHATVYSTVLALLSVYVGTYMYIHVYIYTAWLLVRTVVFCVSDRRADQSGYRSEGLLLLHSHGTLQAGGTCIHLYCTFVFAQSYMYVVNVHVHVHYLCIHVIVHALLYML